MNMIKKCISLVFVLLIFVNSFTTYVFAGDSEVIVQNYIELPVDGTVAPGEFATADDVEYFKFTLETAGMIYFQIKSDKSEKGQRVNGTVYREDMTTVEFTISQYVNEYYEFWNSCDVIDSGTYILALTSDAAYPFTVACDLDAYGDVADATKEPNNTFADAKQIVENQTVSGVLSENDKVDIYSFTLEKRQTVIFYRDAYIFTEPAFSWMSPLELNIYNDCFKSVQDNRIEYRSIYGPTDNNGKEWDYRYKYTLNPGTYYITLNYENSSYRDIYLFKYELSDPQPHLDAKIRNDSIYSGIEAGSEVVLKVADGEVAQWKTDSPKIAKINKKGRVFALAKGYATVTAVLTTGEELEYDIRVINNPDFRYLYKKTTTYFNLKKGQTKTIYIDGKCFKVDNAYKGNSYVKVTGEANDEVFKIKGLKKGLSVIKVKVNRNWYKLTVNVK